MPSQRNVRQDVLPNLKSEHPSPPHMIQRHFALADGSGVSPPMAVEDWDCERVSEVDEGRGREYFL